MEKLDDDHLIAKYKQGDLSAFGTLYDRYSGSLFNYFLRLTDCREEARDLVQETFCKLMTSLEYYEPEGQFKSYLFRLSHNLAIDCLRKRKFRDDSNCREHSVEEEETILTEQASIENLESFDPAVILEKREMAEKLIRAMKQLPKDQQMVLIMKHYSGLTFREIANIIGIPLNTALGRMHYAIRNLKKILVDL